MFIGYNINSWQHIGFTEPLYKYKEKKKKNQLWKNINKTFIASDYFTGKSFIQQRLLKREREGKKKSMARPWFLIGLKPLRQFLIHTQSKRQCRINSESVFIKPFVSNT